MRLILAILLFAFGASAQMPPRVMDDLLMAIPRGSSITYDFTSNIVIYFRMDEASGTRFDSGPNGLSATQGNTVGAATGISNNCATFSNSYLTIADTNIFHFQSNDWTIAGWVKLIATNSLGWVSSQYSVATRGWIFYFDNTDGRLKLNLYGTTSSSSVYIVTNSTAVNTNTWYFLAAGRETGTNWISINDGTRSSRNATNINNSTGPLNWGGDAGGGRLSQHVDEWGVWNQRSLTAAEIIYLYNSGNGRRIY